MTTETPTSEVLCSDCSAPIADDAPSYITVRGDTVCETCYENDYFTCDSCGEVISNDDYAGGGYCNSCDENRHHDDDGEITFRQWQSDAKLLDNKTGTLLTSPRVFGIELECSYESAGEMQDAIDAIPQSYGIHSDGSLDRSAGHDGTCEIVSPPMSGRKAENSVKSVCKLLKEGTADVNASCGFHVHLSAPRFARNKRLDVKEKQTVLKRFPVDTPQDDIDTLQSVAMRQAHEKGFTHTELVKQDGEYRIVAWNIANKGIQALRLRNLVHFYVAFEDVLLAMLPKSRRGNRYCQQLRDVIPDELKSDYSFLEQKWYKTRDGIEIDRRKNDGKYDSSRYHGINLHVLFATGRTLEIRYHSGTLDATKILNWVSLHQRILDVIEKERRVLSFSEHRNKPLSEKVQVFADFLKINDTLAHYVQERIKRFTHEELTISTNTQTVCAE